MNMKIPQHYLHRQPQELRQQESLLDALSPDEKSQPRDPNVRTRQTRVASTPGDVATLLAETNEMQHKRDEQRVLSRNQIRGRIALTKIERLTDLYQLLESPDPAARQQRQKKIEHLLSSDNAPDAGQWVAVTEGDPVLADTLLRAALSTAQRLGQQEKIDAINTALKTLEQTFAQEIGAGINTAEAIAAFTTHPEHKLAMRQLYYSAVIGQQSVETLFDVLLEKFGSSRFELALRTMKRALADDIAALAPSSPRRALHHIATALNDASAISTTLVMVEDFLANLKGKFADVTTPTDSLIRSLIGMCHSGFQSHQLTQLGPQIVGQNPLHQSFFYNQFLMLVVKLPSSLWKNDPADQQRAVKMVRMLTSEYRAWEEKVRPRAAARVNESK
ncbi:type III secretion system gatekeeper subunit SctW [Kosakonia sp. MUSA4]|uniref:type III secretion system gatekeeper subunit SctW n=1 Tax=Kosakonia sp. MUSA4 TaxID=2067958 RepID=UPI0015976DA8|nr:type III secretion system gatekeeper subunit SctW [Kosakonia sp. MUSA4]QJT82620.1 YopN family type III secretion system gatekeeper subunit [Kosakonia sp. MUSA4]